MGCSDTNKKTNYRIHRYSTRRFVFIMYALLAVDGWCTTAVHVRSPDAAWFGFIDQINRLPTTSSTILNLNLINFIENSINIHYSNQIDTL